MLPAILFLNLICIVYSQSEPFIWPLPSQHAVSDVLNVNVDANNFTFTQSDASGIITTAFARYLKLIFPHTPEGNGDNTLSTVTALALSIKDSSEKTLGYGMDESYALSIAASGGVANLTSNTVWGALRGLETFSQLVIFNTSLNYYQTYASDITDTPRFSHRGILIDTSRHFQSKESIMNVLDSMSYSKFNVLHWHIVDSNSFPYESLVYPKLWDGSYSVYERYIQNDVKDIVQHAKSLGIRVIPEFDMPGHANSWCVGYPDICPSESCPSPLNPALNETWDLISGLISEAADIFVDDYMHLGGDEVNTKCWTQTKSIVDWMTSMGFNASEALRYFDEKAIDIANKNGKTVIDWNEVFNMFESTLDPTKVIIQYWTGGRSVLQNIVAKGFRVIFSIDTPWYLDHLTITWQQRYLQEPLQGITDETQQKLVIGGEGCMWGETVDVSDIQQTIWPAAAAIAERLWSPREINSTANATPRYEYFRCLLNERGIAAAPSKNAQDRSAPPQPGSCYDQRRR